MELPTIMAVALMLVIILIIFYKAVGYYKKAHNAVVDWARSNEYDIIDIQVRFLRYPFFWVMNYHVVFWVKLKNKSGNIFSGWVRVSCFSYQIVYRGEKLSNQDHSDK